MKKKTIYQTWNFANANKIGLCKKQSMCVCGVSTCCESQQLTLKRQRRSNLRMLYFYHMIHSVFALTRQRQSQRKTKPVERRRKKQNRKTWHCFVCCQSHFPLYSMECLYIFVCILHRYRCHDKCWLISEFHDEYFTNNSSIRSYLLEILLKCMTILHAHTHKCSVLWHCALVHTFIHDFNPD